MRRNGRFNLALGLALGAALAFLVFLLARPVDDHDVQLVANLAQLLAPTLAAASCAWAAMSAQVGRRAWALLATSAGSWALGQATVVFVSWPGSGSAAPRCSYSGRACSAWPWPTPASPTSSRRSATSWATPPATTCWWPWPARSRPACAARTRSQRRHRGRRRPPRGRRGHVHRQGPRHGPLRAGPDLRPGHRA